MKVMTEKEAQRWCERAGISQGRDYQLKFRRGGKHEFFIEAPEEHYKINALAFALLCFRDKSLFSGGMLWLQRWDIGSPELVKPGWCILESIRQTKGDIRSLEIAPAQHFREDEFVELHAFLIQVIAYGWMADFIPSLEYFVHFKTNRQVCFTATSSETLKDLRAAYHEWSPTDKDPMVVKLAAMEKVRKAKR